MNENNPKTETEQAKKLINSGLLVLAAIILGISILTKFWLKSPVESSWVSQVGYEFYGFVIVFWYVIVIVSFKLMSKNPDRYRDKLGVAWFFPGGIAFFILGGLFDILVVDNTFSASLALSLITAVGFLIFLVIIIGSLVQPALKCKKSTQKLIFSNWFHQTLLLPIVVLGVMLIATI